MLGRTISILANRLVVGFVFAFIYQAITGIATSLLSIPLTGTIQDLILGLENVGHVHSTYAIVWWVFSTILFTTIATQLVRLSRMLPPYRGKNKGTETGPKITVVSLLLLGAIMSLLFFLVDLLIGATSTVSDIQTIYEAAIAGRYEPLAISILFSLVAGFAVVGIVGRASKVTELTRGVGAINIDDIRKKISKKDSVKTTAETSGLAPGTLIHVGKKKVDKTWFSAIRYDGDGYSEISQTYNMNACMDMEERRVNWINITGVHDAGHVRSLGEKFGLHELYQADIMNTELRPALHINPDSIFMVLKMPRLDRAAAADDKKDNGTAGNNNGNRDTLIIDHICILLTADYVISFQESGEDVFDHVRENIRKSWGKFRNMGNDYLAYALIDAIMDNFFVIMESIGDQTEVLEESLMHDPGPETLPVVYALKRQMIILRKMVWPMREVINGLEMRGSPLIQDDTRVYLRDVYAHAVQVMDTIESLREMVGGMLDTYLSSVSNKMNEVMKTLTIIASIFIPITFIAGIYGTNFSHIPELHWDGGYFAMLGVMGAISGGMLLWFRRRSWL